MRTDAGYGRRVLRKVLRTTGSGQYMRDGPEYQRYHFDCGHDQVNLRFDGILTGFVLRLIKAGNDLPYPMRKCWDCSIKAERDRKRESR